MRAGGAVLLAAVAVLSGVRAGSRAEAAADGADCTVSAISDGDSLRCAPDGRRVRLLGIDAPELDQAPWGDSARAALQALLPRGTSVRLERDVRATDEFGRILAWAWLDGARMVNEELARSGYVVALVHAPNVRHADRIRAAVDSARRERRGLWAVDAFRCLPRDHRAGRCG